LIFNHFHLNTPNSCTNLGTFFAFYGKKVIEINFFRTDKTTISWFLRGKPYDKLN